RHWVFLAPEGQREEERGEDQRRQPPAGRGARGLRTRVPFAGLLARSVELELRPVVALSDDGPQRLVGRGFGLCPLQRDGQRGLRGDRQRETAAMRERLAVE